MITSKGELGEPDFSGWWNISQSARGIQKRATPTHKKRTQIFGSNICFFCFFCWLRIPNLYSTVYKLIFVWYCLIIIAYLICNINIYKHLSYFQASPSYFEKTHTWRNKKRLPGKELTVAFQAFQVFEAGRLQTWAQNKHPPVLSNLSMANALYMEVVMGKSSIELNGFSMAIFDEGKYSDHHRCDKYCHYYLVPDPKPKQMRLNG